MGAYYNTAEGKFIDFIYKPDREMMLELAKQEVVTQGLKNKLVTLGDQFGDVKLNVFEEHEEEANKIMKPLGENINTLISQVVKDPENVNLNSQLKSTIKEVTKQLQSGDLFKMQNQYATWQSQNKMYEEMLSKAKEEDERTGIKNQQNIYNAWVKEQVSKGYDPNFKIPGGAGYVNAQKILKETVSTEGLKHIITRPGIQTGINYYNPKTGREGKFDPNTMEVDMERRIVKDKNTGQVYGAAISFDPSIKYLTETEFQTYEHTLEGYYQNTIHQVALANLLNNDAFLSMERQKYRLGGAGGTNEKGEKETEQQYIYRKANEQARIYAAQYAEVTEDKLTAKTNTNAGKLEAIKLKNAKSLAKFKKDLEKKPEIIEITSQTVRRYTPSEAAKIFEEYNSFAGRTNLSPAEQARFKSLQNQFGQAFSDDYLNKIMTVSGVFSPEDMQLSKEEKIKKVLALPTLIKEAKKRKLSYDLSATGMLNSLAGVLTYPASLLIPGYEDKYLEAEKKLQKANIYSIVEDAAKNIVYTEHTIPLLTSDSNSKEPTLQQMLNNHISYVTSQNSRTVLSGKQYPYDMYGRLKTQDDSGRDLQIDAKIPDTYLSYLKFLDGTGKIKDWGTAAEAGHVKVNYGIFGTTDVIYITPITPMINPEDPEKPLLDAGQDFTIVVPDVNRGKKSFTQYIAEEFGTNSEAAEFVRNGDPRYRLITDQLKAASAAISLDPNHKHYFKAGKIDDVDYQKNVLKLGEEDLVDLQYEFSFKDGFYILRQYNGDKYIENTEVKYNSIGEIQADLAKKYVR